MWGFYAIIIRVEDVYEVTLTAEVRPSYWCSYSTGTNPTPIPLFHLGQVRELLASLSVAVSLGLESTRTILTCVGLPGFLPRLRFWITMPPVLVRTF